MIILAGAVAVLGEVYGDLLRAAGATERLMELLDSRSPVTSPDRPVPLRPAQGGSAVAFDAVTFHYPSRPATAALRDFSLEVAPGETVALVGPSGAGKSTVFQLLLRFYDPAQGRIVLDGVATREVALKDLRGRIALVPQDAVIFSSSAMENIRYGKPGASDDEVIAAAKAAFAHEFISALPDRAMRRFSVSGACGCQEASVSESPSPGRCSRTRRCCFLTKQPARSTRKANAWCKRRCSRPCATARPW